MKTFGLNALRIAGWTTFGLLILAGALFVRDWLSPRQITQVPAAQPVQATEPTSTPASTVVALPTSIPMQIDPALCQGPSLSPYMPGEDIAFEGGQVIIDQVTFEFWLTCSKTTENYSPGTNPIEGLGLHTFWIYNGPSGDILSDWYGFQPSIYQAIQDSPVSDATTTSSGASGTLSVANAGGQIPEGMFVLPNLTEPARFLTRLETTQGNYNAAVSFRLESGPEGYRPVDVKVEALPTTPAKYAFEKMKTYPSTAALEGPGACLPQKMPDTNPGTRSFAWPIAKSYVDQEFPGVNLYSQEPNAPVTAADTGVVVFAGESTAGNNYAIVIDHGNGYQTVYFHLREVVVACGSTVEKDQVIGETWNNVEGEAKSYIHFQIYQEDKPINPMGIITADIEAQPELTIPIANGVQGPGTCQDINPQALKPGTGKFAWPVKESNGDQEFPGIILYSQEANEMVSAADDGTVVFAGVDSKTGENTLVIDHGNGYQTLYAHLDRLEVACGNTVAKGQAIGEIMITQEIPQAYLFYAIFFQGNPVPPLNFKN